MLQLAQREVMLTLFRRDDPMNGHPERGGGFPLRESQVKVTLKAHLPTDLLVQRADGRSIFERTTPRLLLLFDGQFHSGSTDDGLNRSKTVTKLFRQILLRELSGLVESDDLVVDLNGHHYPQC